jgi:VRR-NUC domain
VSEAAIQQRIRLALSQSGAVMFRNNVGAYKDPNGRFIQYGVGNPGGSDLIGWTPVVITPDMVGRKLAVFTACEVKTANGKPTEHQLNFIAQVLKAGGFAGIARSPADAVVILRH